MTDPRQPDSNDSALPLDEEALQAHLATEAAGADLDTELGRLETELKDANDRVLRTQAELENYRKRVRREMEDERKYAQLPLLRDLLPVVDNLDRALAAAEKAGEAASLLEGVRMVATQLHAVLEKNHCRRIDTTPGIPFNPHLHEALMQQPSAEYPENSVLSEYQAGYMVYDRVLRPAQVVVSKAPS